MNRKSAKPVVKCVLMRRVSKRKGVGCNRLKKVRECRIKRAGAISNNI